MVLWFLLFVAFVVLTIRIFLPFHLVKVIGMAAPFSTDRLTKNRNKIVIALEQMFKKQLSLQKECGGDIPVDESNSLAVVSTVDADSFNQTVYVNWVSISFEVLFSFLYFAFDFVLIFIFCFWSINAKKLLVETSDIRQVRLDSLIFVEFLKT